MNWIDFMECDTDRLEGLSWLQSEDIILLLHINLPRAVKLDSNMFDSANTLVAI